jgi:hypothetical protein
MVSFYDNFDATSGADWLKRSAELRMLESECGIVDPEPIRPPDPEPEDQSQAGPWWVVPAFAGFALGLVAACLVIAQLAAYMQRGL